MYWTYRPLHPPHLCQLTMAVATLLLYNCTLGVALVIDSLPCCVCVCSAVGGGRWMEGELEGAGDGE